MVGNLSAILMAIIHFSPTRCKFPLWDSTTAQNAINLGPDVSSDREEDVYYTKANYFSLQYRITYF